MSTDRIIKNLRKDIENEQLKYFQFKLNDVLSFTESEIEKLMLLQFINYFQHVLSHSYFFEFNGIEFIKDTISKRTLQQKERIEKYNYRPDGVDGYEKYYGFSVNYGMEGSKKLKLRKHAPKPLYQIIEIYPQYEESVNGNNYRIDIAVILKRMNYLNDKVRDTRKLAIECDGYDYHKDPVKFKQDKIRERELKSNGWKDVLRYSGSEIYSIGDDLEKTKYNIKELMTIIML